MAFLEVKGLRVEYRGTPALHGASLTVDRGEVVAVIGPNGAGKTTLLRALAGLTKAAAGAVRIDGRPALGEQAHALAGRGIALVPQDRGLFPHLSVEDNLRVGGFLCRGRGALAAALDAVYAQFPILRERRRQPARTLSGGEQQMLAIGRALLRKPALLLLDEPSLALAPGVVKEIGEIVGRLSASGTGVLLVEQNVRMALSVAHRAYLLSAGSVVLSGVARDLLAEDGVRDAYFGERREQAASAQAAGDGAEVEETTTAGPAVRAFDSYRSKRMSSSQPPAGR